ncbi:uncharacterized protein UHO2_02328 [Ustilago hordei]|uniref:Uncharacterized protein n=1 Tax=Ustilago hordei TaxID=120017 RepID=I2G6Z7_USTHO|nr:uncharacterized protein UHO2_02328 [Ustilago hordei]CCF54940.1 uncharacterized protein UHOR_01246 [Ustilago hordei]SYW86100.1 uncharacterized protein UHO2_02328 [Ustilago hordei]
MCNSSEDRTLGLKKQGTARHMGKYRHSQYTAQKTRYGVAFGTTFFGIGRDAGINTDHESEHVAKTSSLTTSTANCPASKPELRSLPASFAATAWAAKSAAAPCSRSPGSDSGPYRSPAVNRSHILIDNLVPSLGQ